MSIYLDLKDVGTFVPTAPFIPGRVYLSSSRVGNFYFLNTGSIYLLSEPFEVGSYSIPTSSYVYAPTYKVEFWSGSTLLHGFGAGYTNKISSFRVKPGLTAAIGSFEVEIPDTGSSASGMATGVAFANIEVYDTVKIWYGYTGSGMTFDTEPYFVGKIDTKKVDFNNGYFRTFVGRDLSESLFRILERRGFSGSAFDTIVKLKDDAGLNVSNLYIDATTETFPITLINDNCFKGIKEVVDFDNRDFYTDVNSKFHAFERQTLLGAEAFIEGSNILSYRLFKDLIEVFNQYYVFGMRDLSNITGSDIPVNHDDWTDTSYGGWTGWVKSSSGPSIGSTLVTIASNNTYVATGSYALTLQFGIKDNETAGEFWIGRSLTGSEGQPLMLNEGDFLHLYSRNRYAAQGCNPFLRLQTDDNNYFEISLEYEYNNVAANGYLTGSRREINVGPSYEGISATGSQDTWTGSYRWIRVGNPDWYNINTFKLYAKNVGWTQPEVGTFYYYLDGFYFGTRFQYASGSVGSSESFGYRPKVIMEDRYNSNQYCINVVETLLAENDTPTTQIEVNTIGQPELIMGNKYPLTLLSENIDSNYELIDLEHRWENDSFLSKNLFTNKKQMRIPIPIINYPIQAVAKEKSLIDRISERPWRH